MEVSNQIKEDIRKTQMDLKNAIRVHQVWVSRLHEDENNDHFKTKVKEAENEIIAIGHAQKIVVDRLRRELELYQQCLKSRNKQINMDNDNQYIAQQLRDHQLQYNGKNRKISLLKPSVLTEIHIKTENHNEAMKGSISDSENELKSSLEKDNNSESDEKEKYHRNFAQYHNSVQDSRSNFVNALKKVKETLVKDHSGWHEPRSDTDSSNAEQSPSPSPPPLEPVSQEAFMMLLGLVTPYHKELLNHKIEERRKRASENKPDFLYANYEMMPKRKKYNQFSYLQSNNDPPQTRSAKLRKQLSSQNKSSREGSPSGSSTENKAGWSNNKPAWAASLPPSLSVEPVYPSTKKVCHGCGRNDVPSLLVWCAGCNIWMHTGCGAEGRCGACRTPLPDPAHLPPAHRPEQLLDDSLYRNKLAERKSLQERNIKLCVELRKLETRAATLKANLDEHNAEKRQLLADQINTQRNLQKLLDFISQFKETSISMRSTSASDSSSEVSKSNEE